MNRIAFRAFRHVAYHFVVHLCGWIVIFITRFPVSQNWYSRMIEVIAIAVHVRMICVESCDATSVGNEHVSRSKLDGNLFVFVIALAITICGLLWPLSEYCYDGSDLKFNIMIFMAEAYDYEHNAVEGFVLFHARCAIVHMIPAMLLCGIIGGVLERLGSDRVNKSG